MFQGFKIRGHSSVLFNSHFIYKATDTDLSRSCI